MHENQYEDASEKGPQRYEHASVRNRGIPLPSVHRIRIYPEWDNGIFRCGLLFSGQGVYFIGDAHAHDLLKQPESKCGLSQKNE